MPQGRRAAVALDARDLHRVALRREHELLAPARRVGRPFGGAVDVDDEVPVALPGEAAGVASFAVVIRRVAGPDRVTLVSVGCKLFAREMRVEVA